MGRAGGDRRAEDADADVQIVAVSCRRASPPDTCAEPPREPRARSCAGKGSGTAHQLGAKLAVVAPTRLKRRPYRLGRHRLAGADQVAATTTSPILVTMMMVTPARTVNRSRAGRVAFAHTSSTGLFCTDDVERRTTGLWTRPSRRGLRCRTHIPVDGERARRQHPSRRQVRRRGDLPHRVMWKRAEFGVSSNAFRRRRHVLRLGENDLSGAVGAPCTSLPDPGTRRTGDGYLRSESGSLCRI